MQDKEYLEEATRIISLNQNLMKKARDYVIISNNYTNNDKVKIIDLIETSFNKKKVVLNTTEYDGKPYTMVFMNNLLDFIFNNDFTKNEQQIIYGIYKILNDSNTYGNVLININYNILSEISRVNVTNIPRIMKSLTKKEFLKKDKYGSIYLNYNYFFKGSKIQYDEYKERYNSVEV